MPDEFADVVERALEQDSAHDAGREQSNRDLHRKKLDNGKLEIRLRLLEMRQSYLIQMNTQAALVGGCAVALLASGELSIVNDLTICDHGVLGVPVFCDIYNGLLQVWYVGSAFGCFAISISVIYTSVNLVNMGTLLVVHEHRGDALDELNTMIEQRMDRVRKAFLLSLNCLLCAVCAMVAEVLPLMFFFVAGPMTVLIALNAFSDDRDLLGHFSGSDEHAEMHESLLAERWTKGEVVEWLRTTMRRVLAKAIVMAKAPRMFGRSRHRHHGGGGDGNRWVRLHEELHGAVREELETVAAKEAALAAAEAAVAAAVAAENDGGTAAGGMPAVKPGMFSAHALHARHVGDHALHHEGGTWRFVAVQLASEDASGGGGGGGGGSNGAAGSGGGGAGAGLTPRGAQRACSALLSKPLALARAPCKGPLSIAIAAPGQEGGGSGGGGGGGRGAIVHVEFARLWAELGAQSLLATGAAAERGVLYAFATHLDAAGSDHHYSHAKPSSSIRLRECVIEMLRRARVDEDGNVVGVGGGDDDDDEDDDRLLLGIDDDGNDVVAPSPASAPGPAAASAAAAAGELCFRLAPASDASTAATWYVKGVDEPTTRHWYETLVAHGVRQQVSSGRAPRVGRRLSHTQISPAGTVSFGGIS